MSGSPVPSLPPQAPATNHPVARSLARAVLRLFGWKVVGEFPDVPRLVMIAAPHSTGWDAVWGLLVKIALGLRIQFMAKRELFWFPLGPILSLLGAVPTDRHSAHGVVGQAVANFRNHAQFWLVLAPEGTRRKVDKWRSGFWHIAHDAGVPVQCVYFHYPEKTIGVGPLVHLSDDMAADMARLREYYKPWQGKYRSA